MGIESYKKIQELVDKLIGQIGSDKVAHLLDVLSPSKQTISINELALIILSIVSKMYNINHKELLKKQRRQGEEIDVMQISTYIVKEKFNISFVDLGLIYECSNKSCFDYHFKATVRLKSDLVFKNNLEIANSKLNEICETLCLNVK